MLAFLCARICRCLLIWAHGSSLLTFSVHKLHALCRTAVQPNSFWKYKCATKKIRRIKKSYRSCGVRGCDNFSWLLQPIYGCLNELRMPDDWLLNDVPDTMLALLPPRENEPRVDAVGDVWLELRCDVDHRENPVWPWWLCADGLNNNGLRSDRCDPSELNDVVFEFNPAHRPTSELRFFVKLPGTYPPLAASFVVVLYWRNQSGIFNFCNDAWTRNWCSLSAILLSWHFCSSFSGGWNQKKLKMLVYRLIEIFLMLLLFLIILFKLNRFIISETVTKSSKLNGRTKLKKSK